VATPPAPAAPVAPTLSFLDVGEGAATLIQIPHGPTVLVDAGPAPLADLLRAHGVGGIDLVVLSHGHSDHVAGLSDVIGKLPITAAVLPRPPTPSHALDELASELREHGCAVRRCSSPLALVAGPLGLEVLPTAAQESEANQSENDHALVVVARLGGQAVLLPGDAETPALRPLGLSGLAFVELPHHGSADGFDETLLREYRPRLGIASVGEDNSYGHPSETMLRLMAAAGVPLLRTDQVGEIDLVLGTAGLEVRVARPPPSR
jgi:competence protein ComEC